MNAMQGWCGWARVLGGWCDTQALKVQPALPQRVTMLGCLPFVVMHLGCLAVCWVGVSPIAILLAVGLYFSRMFAITGFYHRYFSHRTYSTSRFFQAVMAVWGMTSIQKGPLWWAAHHRVHHRVSDKAGDIHSPVQSGFWWSHIGWIACPANLVTREREISDFTVFPELMFLNRFDWLVPLLYGLALLGLGEMFRHYWPSLGTNGPQLFVWGFFVSTVFLYHGTFSINSLSHWFGSRRYETGDDSRNNFWLALITMGEGWHNNHHRYPGSVRQGFYAWEVDVTYYVLWIFSKLGLIWGLHPVPIGAYDVNKK